MPQAQNIAVQPVYQAYLQGTKQHPPLWTNPDFRHILLRGGRGSGKSYVAADCIAVRRLMFAQAKHAAKLNDPIRNHRLTTLVIRKTGRTLDKSVVELIQKRFRLFGLAYEYNKIDRVLVDSTGGRVWFVGIDDAEKLKSTEGVTDMWIEEAVELTELDFKTLDLGLRPPDVPGFPPQIHLSFNPVSNTSWLYRHFYKNATGTSKLPDVVKALPKELRSQYMRLNDTAIEILSTYKHNNSLPASMRKALRELEAKGGVWADVNCHGKWGVVEGLIYPVFQEVEHPPGNPKQTYYGIDWGFNNPTAVVRIDEYDGRWYVQEVVYGSGMTTADVAKHLREHGVGANETLYCDAAEPARIQDLYNMGFRGAKEAKKGAGSLKTQVDWIIGNHANVYFVRGKCPNLVAEQGAYSWDKDKDGNSKDAPLAKNDHALDAMRYALYTHNHDYTDPNAWAIRY